ncbi:hypothetical protein DTW90_34510 [Neorhizobium sp. P12A]|nr:hypothetical protein DTW90_34510 [Neorhizobium sp. P12A]
MRAPKLTAANDVAAQVRNQFVNPDEDIQAQLHELAQKFGNAARLIDPTITKAWCFRDGDGLDRVSGVFFERGDGQRVA